MRTDRTVLSLGVLAALVLVVAPAPVDATHLVGEPHCVNAVPAASSGSYDLGRLRTEGYASGSILGVDLRLVDQVSPSPVPDLFAPPGPPPIAQEIEVAGALVSFHFPGLQNTFLLGGAPTTEVAERAFPLTLGSTVAHTGAHTLSAVFSGRVTVWQPESFRCESTLLSNVIYTFTISKIRLDGYATAPTTLDDGVAEPWGLGLGIAVGPGDTSSY